MAERLAIIGASGFVGSALTEYAVDRAGLEVIPFCHSTGGASRLAHRGMSIRQLDLMDRAAVETALSGVDYVANCSRGGERLMLGGLDNLLYACTKAGVKKLVHLSSVAVYGDPPPASSTTEDAPAQPEPGSYGAIKLEQDKHVQRAAANGLRSVILCPPNIIGPYSDYLTDVIQSIETGRFCFIDEGRGCINIVDVNNLSACILCALHSEVADGCRLFACEPADVTWRDLYEELAPVLRDHTQIPSMSSAQFRAGEAPAGAGSKKKRGVGGALKHLASDEVRTALRQNPMWASIEKTAKGGIRFMGKRVEGRLRDTFNGPIKVATTQPEELMDWKLVGQQLRGVKHDPARCQRELGFAPPLTFEQSMQSFREWYGEHFDLESAEWKLLGEAAG